MADHAARWLRIALLLIGAGALLTGIVGGLARMGLAVPAPAGFALAHGPLMISGFLGTVISLERAIAVRRPIALLAPMASAAATVALLVGATSAAALLMLLAPMLLLGLSVIIVRRQPALHTLLLCGAPVAWLVGNVLHVNAAAGDAVTSWWLCFVVLTIAAERLELTRLSPRHRLATPLLLAVLSALIIGAVSMVLTAQAGYRVFGVSLVILAIWLAMFDVARRTIAAPGLARFAAAALLGGYFWLALGGAAWTLEPEIPALRDSAIHAITLGFVVSMIFAHAPIIVPVVARVPMRFTRVFYAPLALLHASLLMRAVAGTSMFGWRQTGGVLNALAIVWFAWILATSRGTRASDAQSRSH